MMSAQRIGRRLKCGVMGVGVACAAWGSGSLSRGADVTATWLDAVSGDWDQAELWSTDPVYPDNTVGTTYDVVVDVPNGGFSYIIDLRTDVAVDNLTIDTPDAFLRVNGGALEVLDTLRVDRGWLTLRDGALSSARLEVGDGAIVQMDEDRTGTLDGVTLQGLFTVGHGGVLTVLNGLTFDEGELHASSPAGPESRLRFVGEQTIGGVGVMKVGEPSSVAFLEIPDGTVTLGESVTFQTGLSATGRINIGGEGQDASFVNEGRLRAPTASIWIHVEEGGSFINKDLVWAQNGATINLLGIDGPIVNEGLIRASAGGIVRLEGDWTNDGDIVINGGVLDLGGEVDLSRLVGVSRINDGVVRISGTLDNTGQVLELDDVLGDLQLRHTASVIGGTIASAAGYELGLGGELHSVVLSADASLTNGSVDIFEGIELQDSTIRVNATATHQPTRVNFRGSNQLLDGTGVVIVEGPGETVLESWQSEGSLTIGEGISFAVNGGRLRIGSPGVTSPTTTDSQGDIEVTAGGELTLAGIWTNSGDITADQSTVTLDGEWLNEGQISLTDSTLVLEGQFTFSQLSAIEATGGEMTFRGVLDNTGSVFAFNTVGVNWNLEGGTILGGRMSGGDGQAVEIGAGDALTLEGVEVDAEIDLVFGGDLTIKGGLSMVSGSALRIEAGGELGISGVQTISGTGEIVAAGEHVVDVAIEGTGGVLTLDGGIVTRNSEQASLHLGTGVSQRLVNLGTISSEVADREVLLDVDWENQGTLRVLDGTLVLGGKFTTAGLGVIDRQGGAIKIRGEMDNTNDVFEINAATGSIGFESGTIRGGTITTADDATLEVVSCCSGAMLDGVTADLDLSISGRSLHLRNGLTIGDGREWELGIGSALVFLNTQSLAGDAQITLAGESSEISVETGQTLTIEPGIVIVKASPLISTIGGYSTSMSRSWINRGMIEINHPEGVMRFDNNWRNEGIVRLMDGTLELRGTFDAGDLGTIERTGGLLAIAGTFDNQGMDTTLDPGMGEVMFLRGELLGGRLATTNGIGMVIDGTDMHGVTLALDGAGLMRQTSEVFGGLTLEDTTLLLGDPQLVGVGSSGGLRMDGGGVISGTGEVVFNTGKLLGNRVFGHGMEIGSGITIRTGAGGGQIGALGESWTNHGVIVAQTADMRISLEGDWANLGTLRLEAGDLFLGGEFSAADIGELERTGGRVVITGAFDNTGNTLALSSPLGTWNVGRGSSISGGTITSVDGTPLVAVIDGATDPVILEDVAFDANLVLEGGTRVEFRGGLDLPEGRTILFMADLVNQFNRAELIVTGGQGITGAGEIVFVGDRTGQAVVTRTDAALTIGPDITIRTGDGQGTVGIDLGAIEPEVVNHGLISAQTPEKVLRIRGSLLTNHGTVEAVNGGILSIETPLDNQGVMRVDGGEMEINSAMTTSELLDIERLGGVLRLYRQLDNTGVTLFLDDEAMTYELDRTAEVLGGRIEAAGGGPLQIEESSSPRLRGVELAADVEIHSSAVLRMIEGSALTSGASVHMLPVLEGESTFLEVDSAALDSAVGWIFFGGLGRGMVWQASGGLSLGSGLTLRTTTGRGQIGGNGNGATVTAARMIAQGEGRAITLSGAGQNINTGEIEALDGGMIDFTGDWRQDGLLMMDGGVVRFLGLPSGGRGGPSNEPGFMEISAVGELKGTGEVEAMFFGKLSNAGVVAPGLPVGELSLTGAFEQLSEGTLAMTLAGGEAGVTYDRFVVDGSVELAGTLALELMDDFVPATGQRFEILEFTGVRAGAFEQVVGEVFAPTGFWRVIDEANLVAVQYLVLGDFDGNGVLDAFDIDEFELALGDPEGFMAAYPDLDPDLLGDFDGDGSFDAFDVDEFEVVLAGGGGSSHVPEPGSLLVMGLGGLMVLRRRG